MFERFARYVLRGKGQEVTVLYNAFVKTLDEKERKFVTEHFALFIQVGEAALAAIPEIKVLLWKSGGNHGQSI